MPFQQRVRLLLGSISPSKFGNEISSFADLGMFIPDPRSRIQIFSIPDPRSWIQIFLILDPWSPIRIFSIPNPGSLIRIKELKYFNPNKWFLSSQKFVSGFHPGSGSGSWLFNHPGSWSCIPDPESRSQKGNGVLIPDPGSVFATLVISDFLRYRG